MHAFIETLFDLPSWPWAQRVPEIATAGTNTSLKRPGLLDNCQCWGNNKRIICSSGVDTKSVNDLCSLKRWQLFLPVYIIAKYLSLIKTDVLKSFLFNAMGKVLGYTRWKGDNHEFYLVRKPLQKAEVLAKKMISCICSKFRSGVTKFWKLLSQCTIGMLFLFDQQMCDFTLTAQIHVEYYYMLHICIK